MADAMLCRRLAAVVELISFALDHGGGPGEVDFYTKGELPP